MKSALRCTRIQLFALILDGSIRSKPRRIQFNAVPKRLACEAGEGHLDPIRLRQARSRQRLRILVCLFLSCCLSTAFPAHKPVSGNERHSRPKAAQEGNLDRSGKAHKGKASYYGRKFYKKKMADGTQMNPQSNAAASKTLPLGTKARVTNLENGKSEVVQIRDRGPYAKGRIVDVSPKTADKLGMKKDGTTPVEVKPIEVPQPDGTVQLGVGAR